MRTVSIQPMLQNTMRSCMVFFVFLLTCHSSIFAQETTYNSTANSTAGSVPQMLATDWILRFEQAYGLAGLYIVEPPATAEDVNAQIRKDLVVLTQQAWRFAQENRETTPTLEALLEAGLIQSIPARAQEAGYAWSYAVRCYTSTKGEEANLLYGAYHQLKAAEQYRSGVSQGNEEAFGKLIKLSEQLEVPELIQREVEARLFAKRQLEFQQVKLLKKVQGLLQELSAAIQHGTSRGFFPLDEPLTMEKIGQFGLIDYLEKLPENGVYVVGKPTDLPTAKFGNRVITLSPTELPTLLLRNINTYLEKYPEYPPALAMRARYSPPESAWKDVNRAIELWNDCPAFRVQRLAMGFDANTTQYFKEDLDYLFSRFPSTPILLEMVSAGSNATNPVMKEWHHSIVEKTIQVRPEVLNLELIAFRQAQLEGNNEWAAKIRDYLVVRHPGYAPLLRLKTKK